MKRGEKKTSCSRGHDTSSAESRDSRGRCKSCHRQTAMRYYRNASKYATNDKYEEMFESQHGLCAICHLPERRIGRDGKLKQLCVDHDHKTDFLRQLLCADCNIALGLMQDDVLRMNSAVAYLLKHRSIG